MNEMLGKIIVDVLIQKRGINGGKGSDYIAFKYKDGLIVYGSYNECCEWSTIDEVEKIENIIGQVVLNVFHDDIDIDPLWVEGNCPKFDTYTIKTFKGNSIITFRDFANMHSTCPLVYIKEPSQEILDNLIRYQDQEWLKEDKV